MTPYACFRVKSEDIAADFPKYLELAKTRSFEIWHDGDAEIMLVRFDAIPEWYRQLQRSISSALLTESERKRYFDNARPTAEELANDRWADQDDEAELRTINLYSNDRGGRCCCVARLLRQSFKDHNLRR